MEASEEDTSVTNHCAGPNGREARVGSLVLVFHPPQLLSTQGAPVVLRHQSLSVLCFLALHSGRAVTKNEILESVWGRRNVTEDSIYQCIREIRNALGDNGKQILKTINKVGYRLNVDELIDRKTDNDPGRRLVIPRLDQFNQQLLYTRSVDGTRIAFAKSGDGSPVLRAPTWMTHLHLDWKCEPIGSKVRSLSHRLSLVRFDARGTGLSDRIDPGNIDDWVEDLGAVLSASGLRQPALIGCSGGATSAIRFARKFPQRISCLILLGGFSRGSIRRGESREHVEAFSHLIREGWGKKNAAFRQLMTGSLFPDSTKQQMDEFNYLQQQSSTAETAAKLIMNIAETSVEADLAGINVPVLILHSKGDMRVPIEEALQMAEEIPVASMITIDSENHVPFAHEPGFDQVQNAIFDFVEQNASL